MFGDSLGTSRLLQKQVLDVAQGFGLWRYGVQGLPKIGLGFQGLQGLPKTGCTSNLFYSSFATILFHQIM